MKNCLFFLLFLPFLAYTQYGVLDDSFGEGGIVNYGNPFNQSQSLDMKTDADGNIYILGKYVEYDAGLGYEVSKFYMTKLFPDGNLDTNFGNNGFFQYGIQGGWANATDFKIIDNQYLLILGYYQKLSMISSKHSNFFFLQISKDGEINSDYADNGLYFESEKAKRNYLKISCFENECLISGQDWNSYSTNVFIQKRNLTGSINPTFANNGTVIFGDNGIPDILTFFTTTDLFEPVILFYTPDYNKYGLLILNYNGGYNHARTFYGCYKFNSLSLTEDRVYMNGFCSNEFLIIAFKADLSYEGDFGITGSVYKDLGFPEQQGTQLLVGENGRLTQIGFVKDEFGEYKFALNGYKSNGDVDLTFGNEGYTLTDVTESSYDVPIQAEMVSQDKILVLNSSLLSLARYTIYDGLFVEDISESPKITLVPNPASNSFVINGLTGTNNLIQIFDLSGKLIREYKTVKDNQKIDLRSVPKGNYIVKIESGVFKESKKLIVK